MLISTYFFQIFEHSFHPNTFIDNMTINSIDALSMLLSILPLSFIVAVIWPIEFPIPLFFIILVIPLIFSAVMKREDTDSTHFIALPHSSVQTSIIPTVKPHPVNHIVFEFSFIAGAIQPLEFTFSLFYPPHPFSFVLASVYPNLHSLSTLFIITPVTLISSSISMEVCTLSVCVIVFPFPKVNITICMNQSALEVCLVI